MKYSVKKLQGGFTMIELIAAMVLVAIVAPTMGLLVQSSLRSMMVNNPIVGAMIATNTIAAISSIIVNPP
jgi:prepilin-type N-terminal cleavage/methylation domain-containing protein